MGYVENNLMKDEQVTYRTTHHWIIFVWPSIFMFIGIYLMVVGMLALDFDKKAGIDPSIDSTATPFLIIGLILFGISMINLIKQIINFKTNEFAVTNKRIIIKIGLIRRSTLELNLDKVESVAVDQSILGRILNYGTIIISGTGSTRQPYKTITAPMDFKKAVQS